MATFKDRGIVLKEFPVGESDKNITLLLKEHGKINVSARGARKPKSKFAPSSSIFAYSDFVIFEGSGFLSLAQCDVLDNFYEIRRDYNKLCYGSFFLEYADKTLLPGMDAREPLYLLLKALKTMEKAQVSPELAAVVFEFKLLQIEGLSPFMGFCNKCGEKNNLFFGADGLVCETCTATTEHSKHIKISSPAIFTINYILQTEIRDLFNFSTNNLILREIQAAAKLFREEHVDIKFKSLELLV